MGSTSLFISRLWSELSRQDSPLDIKSKLLSENMGSSVYLKASMKILISCVFLKIVLTGVKHTRKQSLIIPNTSPSQVWKYMGDFSNYKYLNPHLLDDWTVLENKTDQVYNYRVRYSEMFEHIPWLTNTAEGNFTLFQEKNTKELKIYSEHETCLLPWNNWSKLFEVCLIIIINNYLVSNKWPEMTKCLTTTAENGFSSHLI